METYKKILGIVDDDDRLTKSSVTLAYKKLSRSVHPDKNPEDSNAKENFIKLTEAKNKLYDFIEEREKEKSEDEENDLLDKEIDDLVDYLDELKDEDEDEDENENKNDDNIASFVVPNNLEIPNELKLKKDKPTKVDQMIKDLQDEFIDKVISIKDLQEGDGIEEVKQFEDAGSEAVNEESSDEQDVETFGNVIKERSIVISDSAPFIAHKKCKIPVKLEEAYFADEKNVTLRIRNLSNFVRKTFTINCNEDEKVWYEEGDLLDPNKKAGNVFLYTVINDIPENIKLNGNDIIYYYPVSLYEYLFINEFTIKFMGEEYKLDRGDLPINLNEIVKVNEETSQYVLKGKGMLIKGSTDRRGDLIVSLEINMLSSTLVEVYKNLEEYFPPFERS